MKRATARKVRRTSADAGRKYLSQTDVPSCTLEEALQIPRAITNNYARHPTKPLKIAQSIEMSPKSNIFIKLCGASIAYGLTKGGSNAEWISLTDLGKRVTAPKILNADIKGRRMAFLKPRVIKEFLEKYNNSKVPQEKVALNVLEEIGAPKEDAKKVFDLILEGARSLGFLREVKNSIFVNLDCSSLTGRARSRSKA
jgi:hypothetical protein